MKIKLNTTHIKSGKEYIYEDDEVFNNKELVLPPNQEYTLVIDYPLSTPAKLVIKSGEKGLTRGKFVSLVRKYYQKVYDEEDKSTKVPVTVGKRGPAYNRDRTDGKYGIWGHLIGDLVLVDAEVNKKNVIRLGVDS